MTFYKTQRLVVRQWERSDAGALHGIMSDSRVHTYTGDTAWTKGRTKEYIQQMLGYDFKTLELFHGACVLKATGQFIGLTGLNPYLPLQPELEWQLGAAFWGSGYATELGRATIANAFGTTGITAIYGMANPENKASMRALEKIGMHCLGLRAFRGHQDIFYKIDRNDLL